MKSVTFGYGFPPITYCTWLPKVRGKPWVPPANSTDGQVLMGEQQDLKDLEKIWAPSIQVFHLKEGSAALWLMSNEGLEEKNTMFMQQAKHLAHSFLGSWAPISDAYKYGRLPNLRLPHPAQGLLSITVLHATLSTLGAHQIQQNPAAMTGSPAPPKITPKC